MGGAAEEEESSKGVSEEVISGEAHGEETFQTVEEDSDGDFSVKVYHVVIGDCDTGTCAHLSDHKFVGFEYCEKGFHRLSVDLSKEEKLLLPLEESAFICIACGDGYMSLKEKDSVFRYSQLSPKDKRRWKSRARWRGKSLI